MQWPIFSGLKILTGMGEKIGKPAFKSPPEPENVGGIIAATRSAVQIIESVSLQLY